MSLPTLNQTQHKISLVDEVRLDEMSVDEMIYSQLYKMQTTAFSKWFWCKVFSTKLKLLFFSLKCLRPHFFWTTYNLSIKGIKFELEKLKNKMRAGRNREWEKEQRGGYKDRQTDRDMKWGGTNRLKTEKQTENGERERQKDNHVHRETSR